MEACAKLEMPRSFGGVLVTENSQLVSLFIIPEKKLIFTVDSDFMMRSWSLITGEVDQTTLIKKAKDKDQIKLQVNDTHKLDYVALSSCDPYMLAIADDEGNVTINNLYSGTILFTLTHK